MKRIGGARVCTPALDATSGVPPAVAAPAPTAPPTRPTRPARTAPTPPPTRPTRPARTAPPAVAQRPCGSYSDKECASSDRCELKRIAGARVCTDAVPSTSGVPPAVAPPTRPTRQAPPAVAQRACGTYSDKECASSTRCGLSRVNGQRVCVELAASSSSVARAPPAVPKRCQKNWSTDGRCGARNGGQVCKSEAPFCSNSGRCQARSFGNADFDYPQGCDTA